ncbi:hypothetical protein HUT16_36265 [Kitasatospora sp. NA04385]|uniref:DUF6194 family protein n=1 Tax=Kitasatospora sp. NA04385 TaxID=2742135 RepID=UPI00159098B2|nr:DUF6194 family protein [Kitasatospora sp. NA04385]QKW23835.1 hypothetical protein HUT16_36265 [Kitasatospora sp. NA04385]
MTMEEIIDFTAGLDGVLTLRPAPGDGTPEISWGDAFFYYAPDGTLPRAGQPFATVVTKDYPDDATSRLDRPGAYRVNIAAGKAETARRTAQYPDRGPAAEPDDTVIPHPVHAAAGWLAVVNPTERTAADVRALLRAAHRSARTRYERRARPGE